MILKQATFNYKLVSPVLVLLVALTLTTTQAQAQSLRPKTAEDLVKDSLLELSTPYRNRLMWLMGWRVGGLNFFGAEIEYHPSRIISFAAGLGIAEFVSGQKFLGSSVATRIYFTPKVSSPFIYIGLKDAGLGLTQEQVAINIGRRFYRKRMKSQFFFQVGLGRNFRFYESGYSYSVSGSLGMSWPSRRSKSFVAPLL